MTTELEVGKFYWIKIALDPDGEPWDNEVMPARYRGNGKWDLLGSENTNWQVVWVGTECIQIKE